ncbi:hypothetical protein llap_13379 [Limosa lapponica baueri]|uniref:Uncharacterized protein n=1 Tax=Limosa lapponica baueri TaxID=1758121 RepID=A0A2I0TR92_LIMLA|nr:hypothetical protein llap_13379 [Limosa lapponica baueri]
MSELCQPPLRNCSPNAGVLSGKSQPKTRKKKRRRKRRGKGKSKRKGRGQRKKKRKGKENERLKEMPRKGCRNLGKFPDEI